MARRQPTRVERLGKEVHQYVDVRLDANWQTGRPTQEEIAAEVKEKFGAAIGRNVISRYKNKRWLLCREELKEARTFFRAMEAEFGPHAFSQATQAKLFEFIHKALLAGAFLKPEVALREQRLWAEHDAKVQGLENDKQRLSARLQGELDKVQEVAEVAKGARGEADGKPFDPAAALKKISEVIGVGGALEERVEHPV